MKTPGKARFAASGVDLRAAPSPYTPQARLPTENFMRTMKRSCITAIAGMGLLLIACMAPGLAADTPPAATASVTPEAVVDAQLDAYNRRDLEGFLGYYADDATLVNYPHQVTQTGKDEMRTRYTRNFSNKNVRAEILKRVVFDRFVVDRERVTAPPAKGALEAVAIYEVKDGKIVSVTFLQP
jgi:uncharacterized protein (TIGR02246 family)